MGDTDNTSIIQELRERLIKIETILEQKFIMADTKTNDFENRLKKVEENATWLWRTIIGGIIGCTIAIFMKG